MITAIQEVTGRIAPPDEKATLRAVLRLNSLTKPPGSLGRLEALAVRLAGISKVEQPCYSKRTVVVMAADHGVCCEGVSAFPQEVTMQMAYNFLSGGAAVNVLARQGGAEVQFVDIGINGDISHPQLIDRKVRRGTDNMAAGPAMSRDDALRAILAGVQVAQEAVKNGTEIFITGEMGIGNTTASAAVLCALEGIPPETAAGRGTGIDDERLRHKISVIERALKVNAPNPADPIDVLSKVGGLEIAGLAGLILGAAALRIPVILDGFISGAAALVAKALAPESTAYMIASHVSGEQGHKLMLDRLGLEALLDLGLRLGEGTGGALCLHFIEAVCRIMREMATFESAGGLRVGERMSILVTGGARSGKSGFAERLTKKLADPQQAVYVATGQAFDEEMKARIALHRQQREEGGFRWETLEEPLELSALLRRLSGSGSGQTVLVDCLTLWLSNQLLAVEERSDRQQLVEAAIAGLEQSVSSFQGTLILVTNEVGDGIVPEYSLGRLYRDLAGRMNARLARQCEQVFLVTAGIPVELKSREYIL